MTTEPPGPIPVNSWRTPIAAGGDPNLAAVRKLAWLLDSAIPIPGTQYRVGLDALVGLIPGFGDLFGMVVGMYIVTTAERAGVSRVVIVRMLANVGIDAAVGVVPFAGDVLDAAWRANAKNARLLEHAMTEPARARRSSTWTLVGLVAAVVGITLAGLAATVGVVVLVARQVG